MEKTIKRKKSPEYHSFLQSGLDRFDKVGDNQMIAKNMAEESKGEDGLNEDLLRALMEAKNTEKE